MIFIINLNFFILKIVRLILDPILTLTSRARKKELPPIKNGLLELAAVDLAEKIRNKEIKSAEVVRAFVRRALDVNGLINAVIDERYSEALEEAKEVDRIIENHSIEELCEKYPLLGVPFSVKDCIGVKGLLCAAGSKIRFDVRADENAEVVRVLRAAGAIPICITNVPEFCMNWETVNLLKGKTSNPYDLSRTVGGSSGGEAALIASGGSVFGIGTDVGGSIRMPAHHCGIFGHKPTPQIVSLDGINPKIKGDDTIFKKFCVIGPMTRYAKDLAPLLQVMTYKDPRLRLEEPVNVRNLKIYYMGKNHEPIVRKIEVDHTIKAAVHAALDHFKAKGNFVADPQIKLEDISLICVLLFLEMDTADLMDCTRVKGKRAILPWELLKSIFGKSDYSFYALYLTASYQTRTSITKEMYKEYNEKLQKIRNNFLETLGDDGVYIIPTFVVPAFRHYASLPLLLGVGYSELFNLLGFPATHVPMGLNKSGLPVGFQVVAEPYQDRLCLAVARELEENFGGWVPPS